MAALPDNPLEIAQRFLAGSGQIQSELGSGTDGIVYSTSRPSAIKVFAARQPYGKELAAYSRLAEFDVSELCGHNVPILFGHDDETLVIEMSRVVPPYVLDFGKSDVDICWDFTDEELEARLLEQAEDFDEYWPVARDIYYALRHYGIYYHDLSPRNVAFVNPRD
ncbi:MAG: hypothetical protein GC159_11145 [Phycisphaera sp.]|nr:hypothetical protein [Phycisphaera sp.]